MAFHFLSPPAKNDWNLNPQIFFCSLWKMKSEEFIFCWHHWKICLKILLASLKKNPTLPVPSKIHHPKVEGEEVVDKTWQVPNNSLTTNQLYSHNYIKLISHFYLPGMDFNGTSLYCWQKRCTKDGNWDSN